MSLNVNIHVPFQDTHATSIGMLERLRILEMRGETFFDIANYANRDDSTQLLEELWGDVMEECKDKHEFNRAVLTLLKFKYSDYQKQCDEYHIFIKQCVADYQETWDDYQ